MGDKVSKHHILTPVASPSAAYVILAPHHRPTHDPPHLPAAAPRPAMLHLHFKYRNLFYWGDDFDSQPWQGISSG